MRPAQSDQSFWICLHLQKISTILTHDLQKQIGSYYRAYFLLAKTWLVQNVSHNSIQVNISTLNFHNGASSCLPCY